MIDSFRGAFRLRADQENQSGEAGVILRDFQQLGSKLGWLILVIHHHKKSGDAEGADKLSGTGDFAAAPDVILNWSRPSDGNKPGLLEVEGRIPEVDGLRILLNPDECTFLGYKNAGTAEDEKARIVDFLGKERFMCQKVADETGIPYQTANKHLKALKREGKVDFEEGPGRGSPRFWFAVPQS